jgi:polyphosphate kinase
LKVHSKIVLVERKNKGYVYIGTGNFNESTALVYGDFGLFTADPLIVTDAKTIFDFLLNTHKHFVCKQLMVSPYYMRRQFETLIRREIRNARIGKPAYIYAKFNSLTDEAMIDLLYKAGRAGVEIRLIVRGACCLKPQVNKQNGNIRVISIVDRYLEHARLAVFGNGGDEKVYMMSADWMTRNLDRRVEVGIPVTDNKLKQTLRRFFDIQWSDNEKARDLALFGSNRYAEKGDNGPCRSQVALYDFYKNMK